MCNNMTETMPKADGNAYAEYIGYNPDADDYDMVTSVLQPPAECTEEITRKQISALRRRIDRGGDRVVINHYYRVLSDLQDLVDAEDSEDEDEVNAVDACYTRSVSGTMSHKRTSSTVSDLSMASTQCPESADVSFDDSEPETEGQHDAPLVAASLAYEKTPEAYVFPLSATWHPQVQPVENAFRWFVQNPLVQAIPHCMPEPALAAAGWPGMGMQYAYAQTVGYATPLEWAAYATSHEWAGHD
eukprot:TRINITY_DN24054_c0_g1_i1.p1 TRINITY_DN24054_c0_g1~~TRINITY_DN24054_c0_g1_i1.p1  ORF type:complete len:244 (-),score=42.19 TRINITY_DN24054_c0_g1_i1:219-950(-)